MADWSAWIGRTQAQDDVLTPGLLARFRATLDSAATGDVAAQGVHWCLCLPDAPTSGLGADGHPRRNDSPESFLPPVPLPRRMWASSKVEFIAPISSGASIARQSRVAAITEKSGSTGTLVFVDIDHETHANGTLAIRELQTVVYREATTAAPAPSPADAAPDLANWQWHRPMQPAEPLLFRYSALTFNSHRIHYDLPYARDVERYRALVVHGPLTSTLLLGLAQRELGDNALKSFAFRGMSPAMCGEVLHLAMRKGEAGYELGAFAADGRQVASASAAA